MNIPSIPIEALESLVLESFIISDIWYGLRYHILQYCAKKDELITEQMILNVLLKLEKSGHTESFQLFDGGKKCIWRKMAK